MSDETTVPAETTQAPADVTTRIEAPPTETTATETEAPKPEGEAPAEVTGEEPDGGDGAEEKRKRPSGSERLKRRLAVIETEFERLARENEELRTRTAAAHDPQAGKPGVDRAPTEADYPGDYLAYERAHNAWTTRQIIREEMGRGETHRRQQAVSEIRQERIEAYNENVDQVRERVPDFDKVLNSAEAVRVSPALAEAIMSSSKPALLQYHLAKNPDRVRDMNSLSPLELAREIGRLEARVHLPVANKATKASAPPSEVKGGAAPPVDPVAGPDDMNAYVKWREKQRAKA